MGNLLFSPSGRIGPSEFMRGAIILIIIGVVINLLPLVGLGMLSIIGLVTIWCWVVLLIKRFHDAGKSGWMSLVPILAFIVLGFIINSVVTSMFAGIMQAEAMEKALEAAESGNISDIMKSSMQAGKAISRKIAIPMAIGGAAASYAVAMLTNMMAKHDPDENQWGPAG